MKFVIKDHLEMIPDILSVIEKMTKDEGTYIFTQYKAYLILNKIKINITDKLMRFDTVSTVGYLCTVFHQHDNLKSYIHSILLPAIIRALSDPAEQVYSYLVLINIFFNCIFKFKGNYACSNGSHLYYK